MRRAITLYGGLALLIAAVLCGLCAGALALSPTDVLGSLGLGPAPADWMRAVVLDVRLPRLLLGLLTGAALAQCGVVLQAMFRNPLAEAGLLGVSGGAAFAAALWMVLAPVALLPTMLSAFALPLAASLGAALALLLVVWLSRQGGVTDIATLLLAGLAINAMAGAGIALMQTLASDAALRELTMWLYGNLGRAGWAELAAGLPLLALLIASLSMQARALDALLLGEAEAAHLGVAVERLKRRLLLTVAVAAAVTVALAGIIGFVGLVVPHLLRLLNGPAHRGLLPAAAIWGAALLVLADTAARTLFAPQELPVGVLTALIGVPVFLLLLRRGPDA